MNWKRTILLSLLPLIFVLITGCTPSEQKKQSAVSHQMDPLAEMKNAYLDNIALVALKYNIDAGVPTTDLFEEYFRRTDLNYAIIFSPAWQDPDTSKPEIRIEKKAAVIRELANKYKIDVHTIAAMAIDLKMLDGVKDETGSIKDDPGD